MSRMRRSVIAAALTGLVLTGCSGSGEPEVESTFTPSPTASSSSAAPTAEPTEPALGPEETVRAWVEARNTALLSGDVSKVTALSDAGCEPCAASIQAIADIYAAGGSIESDGWKIVSSRVGAKSVDRAEIRVGLVYSPGVTVTEEGAPPVRFEESKRIATFRLTNGQGAWVVSFLGFLS
ncbi:hypothetical protein GCM10027020_28640 [Nocardioides salsibiostraticola]